MREYDQIADWYLTARSPEVGVPDLAGLTDGLPSGARALDLGCGGGAPIARALMRDGLHVVALDSSAEMVARYRSAFPGAPVRCERAQDAAFEAESFDAVVAWGVLFHLSRADQRAVVHKVSGWLRPRGRFLFTSGDVEGEREGEMDGVAFRYVSLGARGYQDLIEAAGMRLRAAYRDAWDNHVYLADKTG